MARDEIEFFSEIGQWRLRFDAPNDAANTEELCRSAEERFLISIEAESFVAEELADVKKITGARAKIENVKWRASIEPEILNAPDIYVDPIGCVFVRIDFTRVRPIGITLAQLL